MAWKFPKRKTRYDSPIDGDGLSDNFHGLISEAGKLNEHNFSADSTINDENAQIPYRTNDDAAVVITSQYWTNPLHRIGKPDTHGIYSPTSSSSSYGKPFGVHAEKPHRMIPPYGPRELVAVNTKDAKSIKNSPSWQSLKSINGTMQNSSLWIIASVSLIQEDQPFQGEPESFFDKHTVADGGVQLALRLNGAIVWETATMAATEDSDPIGNRELHGPASPVLDAIVPVTAGPFTLELVGRCTNVEDFTVTYLLEGDLIAIEFRR
tara:strand:- start:393 stop:1187 length:795 start_codon:yes stop_codon:yes gene_type:complete